MRHSIPTVLGLSKNSAWNAAHPDETDAAELTFAAAVGLRTTAADEQSSSPTK